jgi:glycogen debranching enzyme
MPAEISVGPPILTINNGSTFMVTDLDGHIAANSEQGVFSQDTRFVSYYEISANGEPWERLSSSTLTYYGARIYLTNRAFPTLDREVEAGTLSLTISRSISEGIHEDLDITNFAQTPVTFNLEVTLRSDFADLFEVKSHRFVRRGRIETHWDKEGQELRTSYENRDFHRNFIYRIASDSPPAYANGRITFDIELQPAASWHACSEYSLTEHGNALSPTRTCLLKSGETKFDSLHREWLNQTTSLSSANEDVYRLYRRSVEDMGALRLHEHNSGNDFWLPAAGVPWFVTIFGRDSLIVSLQCMMVSPGFARGALKKLADYQAAEVDDWRDAKPGKILHEVRFGELAHFHRIPHTPYYGTADATPLYLIALHETWKWLGDDALLREYREVALRCLEWIDRYGDIDGDGFQEYQTRSKQGYENMGWKDAGDAVVYPDGTQVKQPKALCELQGYVFDAWMRMAEVFEVLGEKERATSLRRKATDLQARFEQHFWCEDIGFYAFALDSDKRPVRTIASNPGHLLWSGIANREHAAQVVKRLFEPDMWSGWGIRTLSTHNRAYNPFSYQRGSVWPHDNGIIAMGFGRYGFSAEAARVARDISEAASYFVGYQLPELYAGIERRPGTFPVQYAGANAPQAWAAGSVFHLLQAILGLEADAPKHLLYINPRLPRWLPDVMLRNLIVGEANVDLRFWQENGATRWEATLKRGTLDVKEKPWQPWSANLRGSSS